MSAVVMFSGFFNNNRFPIILSTGKTADAKSSEALVTAEPEAVPTAEPREKLMLRVNNR